MVLGTIDIVLVTENANGHARTGDGRQLDGSRETLVTLGVVVLEADLELDSLEEVPLLGLVGVLEELLDVRTNAGNRDFRHVWLCVSQRIIDSFGGSGAVVVGEKKSGSGGQFASAVGGNALARMALPGVSARV